MPRLITSLQRSRRSQWPLVLHGLGHVERGSGLPSVPLQASAMSASAVGSLAFAWASQKQSCKAASRLLKRTTHRVEAVHATRCLRYLVGCNFSTATSQRESVEDSNRTGRQGFVTYIPPALEVRQLPSVHDSNPISTRATWIKCVVTVKVDCFLHHPVIEVKL